MLAPCELCGLRSCPRGLSGGAVGAQSRETMNSFNLMFTLGITSREQTSPVWSRWYALWQSPESHHASKEQPFQGTSWSWLALWEEESTQGWASAPPAPPGGVHCSGCPSFSSGFLQQPRDSRSQGSGHRPLTLCKCFLLNTHLRFSELRLSVKSFLSFPLKYY